MFIDNKDWKHGTRCRVRGSEPLLCMYYYPHQMKPTLTALMSNKPFMYFTSLATTIIVLYGLALLLPDPFNADALDKATQINNLRTEQIKLEQDLLTIQEEWEKARAATDEADRILQAKVQELKTVEQAGNEIRTQITTIHNQVEALKNGQNAPDATGF